MKVGVGECPLLSSVPLRLRLSLTLIVTLMVFSSASLTISNPVSAAPTDATPSAPSTIGQDGFTTQALGSVSARPTNDIVHRKAFYDIVFVTSIPGSIKKIQVTFPANAGVPSSSSFNEAEGIGPGTVSTSGQTLTYTVNNAVNIPAGTKIRLEFANIVNPLTPNHNYKVIVTTRNAANAIIDGPTQSAGFLIEQIGTNAIADGTQKLLFAKCTLPASSPAIPGGSTVFRICSVPGVQVGDSVEAEYDGDVEGAFYVNLITHGAHVYNADSVTLLLGSDSATATIPSAGQIFSLIVFRK
jgi:hypothetical protein